MADSDRKRRPQGYWPESDPPAYEQACLREAMRSLADIQAPQQLFGIWLEGAYPETRLVVDLASRYRARDRLDWHLWGDDFGKVGERGRASPQLVGDDVGLQVDEFQ